MIPKIIIAAGLSLVAFLPISGTSAHTSGLFFERQSGAYIIELEYDTPVFKAQEAIRFGFVLEDAGSRQAEEFDHIWIRIIDTESNDRLIATGLARQATGPSTLLYMFADGGSYSFAISFRDSQGQDIATTSIPLTVEETENKFLPLMFIGLLVITLLSVSTGFFFGRRKT